MDTTQTPPPKPAVCEELLPRHRCGTCAEWTRHTDPRMPEHGECTQRETGRYSHQASICLFETARWSQKKC